MFWRGSANKNLGVVSVKIRETIVIAFLFVLRQDHN